MFCYRDIRFVIKFLTLLVVIVEYIIYPSKLTTEEIMKEMKN